jgi:hypothetical protein
VPLTDRPALGDVLRAAELYATLAAACDGIGHVFAVMGPWETVGAFMTMKLLRSR